jgi:class 3 adenylate cyclase
MTFEEILAQVREQLQRERRVAYRILKRRFDLSDDDLEDLKADLIDAKRVAVDEDGKVLVWKDTLASSVQGRESEEHERSAPGQTLDPRLSDPRLDAAERRQLTMMFCDVVGSTALSEQLDPEDLREVVRTYQQVSAAVISRLEGHMAQYLGDGLLVYFGYPIAHEDDAQRAVWAALGIVEAIQKLSFQTIQLPRPLQVRVGIHTGLVVVGEIGSSEKREILALGETPNLAARMQGLAEPDTIAISAATHRLVQGFFTFRSLGSHILKGISTTMEIYQVLGESGMQSRFEVAVGRGLTPLVGREEELGLLRRRWEQAKERAGQVVLLSGEAGIGKSRLVQTLKEQVSREGTTRIEFRCSPYHQNSAFYPIIDHLQRLLQFAQDDAPQAKLAKLQQVLAYYRFPQADTLPLVTALLSLPQPEGIVSSKNSRSLAIVVFQNPPRRSRQRIGSSRLWLWLTDGMSNILPFP